MKVLVLGGSGMIGHKLCQVFRERFETWVTLRAPLVESIQGLPGSHQTITSIDVTDLDSVEAALNRAAPDVVINCVGIVKQSAEIHDPIRNRAVNAVFPHQAAALCTRRNARFIHISTDCVFSGHGRSYTESDPPEPSDPYGSGKLMGEVDNPHLTLRLSTIGRELRTSNGLVEWFLAQRGKVRGYPNVFFSGFPTLILAELLASIVEHGSTLTGVWHVSADRISKYDLLLMLRDAFNMRIEIEPYPDVRIDRSLDSARFRSTMNFKPEPWDRMVARMAADAAPYDRWRTSLKARSTSYGVKASSC